MSQRVRIAKGEQEFYRIFRAGHGVVFEKRFLAAGFSNPAVLGELKVSFWYLKVRFEVV